MRRLYRVSCCNSSPWGNDTRVTLDGRFRLETCTGRRDEPSLAVSGREASYKASPDHDPEMEMTRVCPVMLAEAACHKRSDTATGTMVAPRAAPGKENVWPTALVAVSSNDAPLLMPSIPTVLVLSAQGCARATTANTPTNIIVTAGCGGIFWGMKG